MNDEMFGVRLKQARKVRKFTAAMLAEKTDISANSIYSYENARKTPKVEVLINICNTLSTSPDYLLMDSLMPDLYKPDDSELGELFPLLTQLEQEIVVDLVRTMINKKEIHKKNNKYN